MEANLSPPTRSARVSGPFGRGGARVTVWSLQLPSGSASKGVRVWRDARGKILRAEITECSAREKLAAVSIFSDRQSLRAICYTQIGAGDTSVEVVYYHAFGRQLAQPVLTAALGANTIDGEGCVKKAGGWVKVLTRGKTPRLRVAQLRGPQGTVAEWTFEPRVRRFVKTSRDRKMTFDTPLRCPQRPPR